LRIAEVGAKFTADTKKANKRRATVDSYFEYQLSERQNSAKAATKPVADAQTEPDSTGSLGELSVLDNIQLMVFLSLIRESRRDELGEANFIIK